MDINRITTNRPFLRLRSVGDVVLTPHLASVTLAACYQSEGEAIEGFQGRSEGKSVKRWRSNRSLLSVPGKAVGVRQRLVGPVAEWTRTIHKRKESRTLCEVWSRYDARFAAVGDARMVTAAQKIQSEGKVGAGAEEPGTNDGLCVGREAVDSQSVQDPTSD